MSHHEASGDGDSVRTAAEILLNRLCAKHSIDPIPSIQWSTRMSKTLGRAFPRDRKITLSSWLDFNQAMNTVRHELAHIAVGYPSNEAPHGPKWREWAVCLGAEPRAASLLPPTRGPDPRMRKLYWGLKCLSCGSRFLRAQVKPGLYHRECGMSNGRLTRNIHDVHPIVSAWVREV